METVADPEIDQRLAARLKALRIGRGMSLDMLADASGVSRATLSRIENAAVSPTASVLNRICSAFGTTMSHLMTLVEAGFAPVIRKADAGVWRDPESGFERRIVSPPSSSLAGEAIEGRLPAGAVIEYAMPPRPNLEHHLIMLEGSLRVTVAGQLHELAAGDCLRYRLDSASRFEAGPVDGARYLLFMV